MLHLRLELLSETTFGKGEGVPADVDLDIEHDARTGLPYVRGSVVKGLLVEACADVLHALGTPPWAADAAQRLFGRPGSRLADAGRVSFGRGRLPALLHDAVKADVARGAVQPAQVRRALTRTRTQTAVDETTGTPEDTTLRMHRVLRQGLCFTLPLYGAEALSSHERALLSACARMVQRAGTARTRGRGRIRLRLFDGEGEVPFAPAFDEPTAPDGRAPSGVRAADSGDGLRLRLRVRLLEPVVSATLAEDPNLVATLAVLPGAVLRGALVQRVLALHGTPDLSSNPDAAAYLLRGDVVCRSLFPVHRDRATRPVPRSLYETKNGDEAHDFAVGDPDGDDRPWKPIGTPLWDPSRQQRYTPSTVRALHHQRSRTKGRPTSNDGAVYQVEALADGLEMEAHLVCATPEAARWVRGLVPVGTVLKLGGARTTDYGAVEVIALDETTPPSIPPSIGAGLGANPFTVGVLSPLLVRSDTGSYDPAAAGDRLAAALSPDPTAPVFACVSAFVSDVVVGGFNRRVGLPLRQARAVAPGSVFVFHRIDGEAVDPIDLRARLFVLERDGFGERRAEGYGVLDVAHAPAAVTSVGHAEKNTQKPPSVDTQTATAAHELATAVAEAMLRERLDRAVRAKALKVSRDLRRVSPSQLGRVQSLLLQQLYAPPEDGRRAIEAFVQALPRRTRETLERTSLSSASARGASLMGWLSALASDPDTVRTELGQSKPVMLGASARADLTHALAFQYGLRLGIETLRFARKHPAKPPR